MFRHSGPRRQSSKAHSRRGGVASPYTPMAQPRAGVHATPVSPRDLDRLDPASDLDHRILHVSADGLAWLDLPACTLSTAERIELYRQMALTRAVDREIVKMLRKGLGYGKHLTCTGNEATAVGAVAAMRPREWATLAIRDLGAYIVRGVPIADLLAQVCGRTPGMTNGWDGSLHMGRPDARLVGLVSHLGTLVALGTGLAFAERYRDTDHAVLAFIGEGSTSTGDVHEALNIATVMHLPLVLVIENNQWAFGTPRSLQYAAPTLALRALAYGNDTEGYLIDGTNVTTVHATVATALERARRQRGVTIIEAMTMRLEGHSLADPFGTYVPAEQLAQWQDKDPVASFRARLLTERHADEPTLQALESRIAAEVLAAALEAEACPPPDGTDIERHVFAPSAVFGTSLADAPASGSHITYHRAIHDGLREELERDPTLFIVGEDIGISNGAFKVTEGFSREFDGVEWKTDWTAPTRPRQRRVIDAPIAEAGFCGLAAGAVLQGLRAVVEFQYADFASEAFKMIVNYAATQQVRGMGPVPIVFRMPSGWAHNTSLYHSVNPESWFASSPGLKIVAPTTAFDAKGLLKAAIRDGNPVLFLEYKQHYRIVPDKLPAGMNLAVPAGDYVVPLGCARVVRAGRDATIVTYGSQIFRALEAASILARDEGASVEVIDLRSLIPLDIEAIRRSVARTSRVLVTCEAPRTGCYGATIVTEIVRHCFDDLDAPVTLVAAADTPVPFAPALEAAHLPTTPKIVEALRSILAH